MPLDVAAARWMRAHVIGVPALDATLVAGVVLVMFVVALAACWLPARRTARVDPVAALRAE